MKVVGIVMLILWIAWASWEILSVKEIALETCGLVVTKMGTDGGFHVPVDCPALTHSEINQGKP